MQLWPSSQHGAPHPLVAMMSGRAIADRCADGFVAERSKAKNRLKRYSRAITLKVSSDRLRQSRLVRQSRLGELYCNLDGVILRPLRSEKRPQKTIILQTRPRGEHPQSLILLSHRIVKCHAGIVFLDEQPQRRVSLSGNL